MSANAVYSAAYECIGFTLAYTYLPYDVIFGGYASYDQAPRAWIISATSASASSVSAKSGSGFSVLGYYIGWPTPAQILADWIAVYGDLPTKGTIYFSVRPADPFVGVTGMEMTSSCEYENGTLASAIIPPDPSIYFDISTIWVGPTVTSDLPANQLPAVGYEQAGAAIIPPGGANDVQLFFQGVSAFGGNGWTAGAPYAGTLTCEGKIASVNAANKTSGVTQTTKPTPPITVTFNPPTVTIVSGDTTPAATTATFHLPAGTPSGTWLFHLKGTDGKQTLTQKILVECNAGAPSASGLSLTPMVSDAHIATGQDCVIDFTLEQPEQRPTNPRNSIPADMQTTIPGNGLETSVTFRITGPNPVTVPAGTPSAPGHRDVHAHHPPHCPRHRRWSHQSARYRHQPLHHSRRAARLLHVDPGEPGYNSCMDKDSAIVLFLLAQAGALIWILSRHDTDIRNLRGWVQHIARLGEANGRNIGVLEGINKADKED